MIREFRRSDTEAVLALVLEAKRESPLHRDLPWDPGPVAGMLNSFTVKGWVVERSGQVVGCAFATLVPSMLGVGRICTDLGVFVRPGWRNGIVALRLLRNMEEWGDAMGVIAHQHAVSSSHPGVERLYRHLGYRRTGGAFMRLAG